MNDRMKVIQDDNDFRIVAISDIHGYLDLFKSLMNEIKLKEKDYLIILGDSINKGEESLETIHYLMELNKRNRTHIISGNHEATLNKYLFDDSLVDELLGFLKQSKRSSLVKECLAKLEIKLDDINSGLMLREILLHHYKPEFDFLNNLFYGIEINNYVFVHAGLDEVLKWQDSSLNSIFRIDEYYRKTNRTDKVIVVGHWPTQNMRQLDINNDILFFDDKNIICIDGGTIKANKQLNALIITKRKQLYEYETISHDPYKEVEVTEDCIPLDKRLVKFDWRLNSIEMIKEGPIFSLCKNSHTQEIGYVFSDMIIKDGEIYLFNPYVVDYVSRFLDLKKGNRVKFILSHGEYALVKHQNQFGWVLVSNLNL